MREFDTSEYRWTHGKLPRGCGTWAFVPIDYYWRGEVPADGIAWEYGTLGEAKQEVARKYPEIRVWNVLP